MRITALAIVALLAAPAAALTLEEYLPPGATYDPAIPTPRSVLGFEVGEWHVRHDRLVAYLEALAAASPRVRLERTGETWERRPLLLLTVSSPDNLADLDSIAARRREGGGGPLVVWQGFSVHGNEASGANAAMLLAYHLAAARGPEVEALLADTLILIDPSLNPDGLDRFAGWVNSLRPRTPNPDPEDRLRREPWPNGRTNHYWFDLNRDWILLVHPETRARIGAFHRWRPHVVTDFHEMGSDATLFFQPGVPGRTHPLTPERNVQLTRRIAGYHAEALEGMGRLYFTEEIFDDFYFGKGSTYPDINGAIGILFEQASSRGPLIENSYGELDFPTTVQNQLVTSLSTLRAAHELRDELVDHQREFYERAAEQARRDPVRAWVVGDGGDPVRAHALIERLRRHEIEVHELAREVGAGGRAFRPGHAWVVPAEQRQYLLAKALMERRTEFADSTFYDVSTWTLPLSFDLPHAELDRRAVVGLLGEAVAEPRPPRGSFSDNGKPYAWVFDWSGYLAPRALQRLLAAEARVYAATKPFSAMTPTGERAFGRGSIVVPAGIQPDRREAIEGALMAAAAEDGIDVHALGGGMTPKGIDLGSPSLRRVEPLRVLMPVGRGLSAYAAGEVRHLLDTRVGLPLTMVDRDRLEELPLGGYTHLVLVDGEYGKVAEKVVERLRAWVEAGGVLVAEGRAAKWVGERGLDRKAEPEKAEERGDEGVPAEQQDEAPAEEPSAEERFRPYASFADDRARRRISGAIVEVRLDTTHPVAFGYEEASLPVFRSGTVFLEPSENRYETVARYADEPLLSGFVSPERLEELRGGAAVVAGRVGRGTVVRLADDPNFRGIWYGTNRLFLNALFFGRIVDATKLD